LVRKPLALFVLLFLVSPVLAGGIVYIASDSGDVPLYEAVSEKIDASLSSEPGGELILALDLNYNFLNDSQRVVFELLRAAHDGKTVVVGFNTLRTIEAVNPSGMKLLGISANFTGVGIITVRPGNGFDFRPFGYDSDAYGIALVKARSGKVLLNSTEGYPVLIEVPVGKGRLVIVTLNLPAYYLDTRNPAVVDFVVAIVKHYSRGRIPLNPETVVGIVGAVGAIAYVATSSNPQAQRIRDALKALVFVIAHFIFLPKDVLRNPVRRKIYGYIAEKGYATINDVVVNCSISRTNARWHLGVLKRAKLIEETPVGNTFLFHLPGKEGRRRAIEGFLLENELRRKIYLLARQGKSLTEIARTLGVSKSTVHHHMEILKRYGLLGGKRRG
jgi:DNA-binding transcriptional ArsR family regulator